MALAAVFLQRPHEYEGKTETINDKDCLVANFWRAIKHDPEQTAYYADNPVNHADVEARRRYIARHKNNLCELLLSDPETYDCKLAGYWVYVICNWIGPLYLSQESCDAIPHLGNKGRGIHAQKPYLSSKGQGIRAQKPYLSSKGQGIRAQKPHIISNGRGIHRSIYHYEHDGVIPKNVAIYDWFKQLSDRFKRARVVCGDWYRVCGGNWQDSGWNTVGIFFDPPYSDKANRYKNLYLVDCLHVAKDVAEWAYERGKKDNYRIVLAGYYEEHEWLLQHGWRAYRYKVSGGFSHQNKQKNNNNRFRETLFISPHCLLINKEKQPDLFGLQTNILEETHND